MLKGLSFPVLYLLDVTLFNTAVLFYRWCTQNMEKEKPLIFVHYVWMKSDEGEKILLQSKDRIISIKTVLVQMFVILSRISQRKKHKNQLR